MSEKLPDSVLEKIKELGFDQTTTHYDGSHYIVEGDIMLPVDLFKSSKARTDQATENGFLVSFSNQQVISVSNQLSNSNWNEAINLAVSDWNGINNCQIAFASIGVPQVDIEIRPDNGTLPDLVIASALFPSNGKAGAVILVNLDYDNNKTVSLSSKRYNMVHELGHTLGLRHTNWVARGESAAITIPGTPATDANSVMNGGTADNNWNGFSSNDVVAIKALYPQNNEISNWINSATTNSPSLIGGGAYLANLNFSLSNSAHPSTRFSADIYTGDQIYSHVGTINTNSSGTYSGNAVIQIPPQQQLRLKVTDVNNPQTYDFINLSNN